MLKLEQLTKLYPAAKGERVGGIRNADFELAPGAFFTLLGPSGCGKTTTLRCIAGLELPDSGRIVVGDRTLFDGDAGIAVPMHQRNIGMVFQSYAIWPHMTVAENVSFPLRIARHNKPSKAEIEIAVTDALQAVGLDGYGGRSATQLSGGQQQRVALARAIVHKPKLLLLDEPLSNLDASLREDMRTELKRLQSEIGITAVYVTHDQTEALAMSDQIAVISEGKIVQLGAPKDIYLRPATEFVAGFIGHTNILQATFEKQSGTTANVRLSDGTEIQCGASQTFEKGSKIAVVVRPENITLRPAKEAPKTNALRGKVNHASFLGNVVHYKVAAGDQPLQIEANPALIYDVGDEIAACFDASNALAIPANQA